VTLTPVTFATSHVSVILSVGQIRLVCTVPQARLNSVLVTKRGASAPFFICNIPGV